MHCTDRHLSDSLARNSTKALWTSSSGGAGMFVPGVLGVGLGFGVGRGPGVEFAPFVGGGTGGREDLF